MDPESILYVIHDRSGRLVAFPTRQEAEACLIPEVENPTVKEKTFAWLLENAPKALIRIYYQYYWAEELA
jgi:hypothetical protein